MKKNILLIALVFVLMGCSGKDDGRPRKEYTDRQSVRRLDKETDKVHNVDILVVNRKIERFSFGKDTTVTVLPNGGVIKSFRSYNCKEIIKYACSHSTDTTYFEGLKATMIIYRGDCDNAKPNTVIITRSLLNKTLSLSEIEELHIANIHYECVNNDTITFSIPLTKVDSDYGYTIIVHYNCSNRKITIENQGMFEEPDEGE